MDFAYLVGDDDYLEVFDSIFNLVTTLFSVFVLRG